MRQNPTHTSSLKKAGMEGIQGRGKKREGRRGDERGEGKKRREKEKEQEQEKTGVKATLHTHWGGIALSSARRFFQKEKRSSPHRGVPATENGGMCVSTHTATVSAHGLLAGAGV